MPLNLCGQKIHSMYVHFFSAEQDACQCRGEETHIAVGRPAWMCLLRSVRWRGEARSENPDAPPLTLDTTRNKNGASHRAWGAAASGAGKLGQGAWGAMPFLRGDDVPPVRKGNFGEKFSGTDRRDCAGFLN